MIDVKGVDSITIADSADLKYDGQVTAGTLYSDLGNDVRDYKQTSYIDGVLTFDQTGIRTRIRLTTSPLRRTTPMTRMATRVLPWKPSSMTTKRL